jgi:rhamnose utilization protein RhaD (predicted bifunctional aldolase and dehydrogenase)
MKSLIRLNVPYMRRGIRLTTILETLSRLKENATRSILVMRKKGLLEKPIPLLF